MKAGFCEFCKKVLDPKKLENQHGCLDCAGSIYINQSGDGYICIHCIEKENEKFKAALVKIEAAGIVVCSAIAREALKSPVP